MIVENKRYENLCSFYVSDYHLEMMLVPYINKKIENNEAIDIETEKDLKDTVEILISKMNLKEENKQKILNLNWNKKEKFEIKENSNTIIVGTEEYINKMNKKIKDADINVATVLNCYNFDEIKDDIGEILNNHNQSLNTLGFNKI